MFRILENYVTTLLRKKFHKHFFIGGAVALLFPIHTVFHRSYSPAIRARNEIFYTTLDMKFSSKVCVLGGGRGGVEEFLFRLLLYARGRPFLHSFINFHCSDPPPKRTIVKNEIHNIGLHWLLLSKVGELTGCEFFKGNMAHKSKSYIIDFIGL